MIKTKKRTLIMFLRALIFAMTLFVAISTITTFATETVTNGNCGENVSWSFNAVTGCLHISGTGDMTDYSERSATPWYSYTKQINKIIIDDGVTSIGRYAFSDCTLITDIEIPTSVTKIGSYALYGCNSLESATIPFVGASAIASNGFDQVFGYIFGVSYWTNEQSTPGDHDGVFQYVKKTSGSYGSYTNYFYHIPSSVKKVAVTSGASIAANAFYNCENIENITLAPSVTDIGEAAFYNCTSLENITIPENVTSIGSDAFRKCTSLYSVMMKCNAPTVGTSSFPSNDIGKFVVLYDASCTGYISPRWNGYYCAQAAVQEDDYSMLYDGDVNCQDIRFVLDETNKTASVGDGISNNNSGYYGQSGRKVVIPQYVYREGDATTKYTVNLISAKAFYGNSVLQEVTLPSTIESIGTDAFRYCPNIERFIVDKENRVFNSDETGALYIGNTRLMYYPGANKVASYKVLSTVTQIDAAAFHGARHLKSLTLPFVGTSKNAVNQSATTLFGSIFGSVSYGGGVGIRQYYGDNYNKFYYIPSALKSIAVEGGNLFEHAFNNCSNVQSITIGDGVSYMGEHLFRGCTSLTELTLPYLSPTLNTATAGSGTLLGSYFGGCDTTVTQKYSSTADSISNTIPSSLQKVTINGGNIFYGAFSGCSTIKEFKLGNGVVNIEAKAFSGCREMVYINIPSSIKKIGNGAFDNTAPGTVEITDLAHWCSIKFESSSSNPCYTGRVLLTIDGKLAENIVLPEGIEEVPDYAFDNMPIKTIVISTTVKHIGKCAFYGSFVEEIIIPGNVESIDSGAFGNSPRLKSVILNEGIKTIGEAAFGFDYFHKGNDAIAELTIPGTVTTIGDEAFSKWTNVKTLVIPQSVTTIGKGAFLGWSSLEHITIPFIGGSASSSNTFGYIFGNTKTDGCYSAAKQSCYIPSALKTVIVTEGALKFNAFADCSSIETIIYPVEKSESVPRCAFYGCTNLKTIALPSAYNCNIGNDAFAKCSGLSDITITNNIIGIGDFAFSECTSLKSVVIPNSVEIIGASGFSKCSSLENITIGNGVTSIGAYAFGGCTALKTIVLGEKVSDLTGWYFNDYTNLQKIVVDENNATYSSDKWGVLFNKDKTTLLKYPQSRVWQYYDIPESTITINPEAFYNCKKLLVLLIPQEVNKIYTGSIQGCINLTANVYNGSPVHAYLENNQTSIDFSYAVIDSLNLQYIRVLNQPTATEFVRGIPFDFDGLYIVGSYDNGVIMQISEYDLIYDPDKLGEQTVRVVYNGFETTFDIFVRDKNVIGIEVVSSPNQTIYPEGTDLDLSGLILNIVYEDNTTRIWEFNEDDIRWESSSANWNNICGTHTITIFGSPAGTEYSTTFEVTVNPKVKTHIKITALPKRDYIIGDAFEPAGLEVTLYYDNGTFEVITDFSHTPYEMTTYGTKKVIISYETFTDSFEYFVDKKSSPQANIPVIAEITDTSIKLKNTSGMEYSMDGIVWQDNSYFENLSPNTAYVIYQRYKETDTVKVGESSEGLTARTKFSVTGYIGITGTFIEGYTLTADISTMRPNDATIEYVWYRNSEIIVGATAQTYVVGKNDAGCKISVAVIGCGDYYGRVVSKSLMAAPAVPTIVSRTSTSITLTYIDGFEYSKDGGATWQDSSAFSNLTSNATYSFCQRVKESDTMYVSASSAPVEFVTLKVYSFVIKNEDGTVLSDGTADEGSALIMPNNPSKAESEHYTYSFIGWDFNGDNIPDDIPEAVTSNISATAVYSANCKHISSSWIKAANSDIENYTCDNCSVVLETRTGHVYSDWSQYDAVHHKRECECGYIDYATHNWNNGTVNSSPNCVQDGETSYRCITCDVTKKVSVGRLGHDIVHHDAKAETCTTIGWDAYDTCNRCDYTTYVEIPATGHNYVDGHCTNNCGDVLPYIIFKDYDGTIISSAYYAYGATVVVPNNPARASDHTFIYNFAGWDKKVIACAGDATYTATYTATYIDYTVIFKNENGMVLKTSIYHYGDTVTAPSAPTKSADNTYTYSFKGWDKTVVNCAGDAIYTATYDSAYIDYTVIFKDENGTVLSANTYHYGDDVIEPQRPTKNSNHIYIYEFNGWNQEVKKVSGNATYIATYLSAYIEYTIIFKNDDGTNISSSTYHYGQKVSVPSDPTKPADETYDYLFNGWDGIVVTVNGDATYTATYRPVYINYVVAFKNDDGTVISTNTYHYGDRVTAPAAPAKASDNTYTYSFKAWDRTVVNCAGNATYTATYDSAYIDYTVIFKDENGAVLSANTYHYGDKVTVPDAPVKAADNTYTYVFKAWNAEVADCTGNATYTATYNSAYIDYTVIFKNEDGTVLKTSNYHYGDAVIAPPTPTKETDNEYTYTFRGWDATVVACTGNAIYTATYTATEIKNSHISGSDTELNEPKTDINAPSDNGTDNKSEDISGKALAGIAAGSAVAVGTGVFSLFWFVIKKKRFSIKKK